MGTMTSQITSLTIVYSTVYSGTDQSKHQSSASLAFVWRIHQGPVNSPHKWPVMRKMFPFDDVIMYTERLDKTCLILIYIFLINLSVWLKKTKKNNYGIFLLSLLLQSFQIDLYYWAASAGTCICSSFSQFNIKWLDPILFVCHMIAQWHYQLYSARTNYVHVMAQPGVGVKKRISLVPLLSKFFHNCPNTGDQLDTMFIFERCRCSWAVVTPVKYECDVNHIP